MNGAENGSFNPEAGGVSAEWTDLGGYTDEQGRVSADRLRRDFPQMPNEPDGDYEARISSMLGDADVAPEFESSVDRSEIEADLRGSFPQQPDESAEDYEARIAGMVAKTEEGYSKQARAEERERAEMENREAARELEEFYRQAESYEREHVEAALEKNADKYGGTENDQYKDAASRQRRASESRIQGLRARIDSAVAAGEAKKLLGELKEEKRVSEIRDEYMVSGEMGRDGTKIGEEIEGEEKKLKEAYEKLRKIEGGIRRTKEGIVAIESDIEGLKKDLETKEKEAKAKYDQFLERIDALPQAIYNKDRKDTMIRGFERAYKEELEKAKKEYAELLENKGKELTEKQESLQAQEQERAGVKSSIASINGRIANIKRRAQEAFPYERGGDEAYEQWLKSHQPEETKEEPVESNDGEKDAGLEQDDKDGSSEVDKGISGEDDGGEAKDDGEKDKVADGESGNSPERVMSHEEFMKHLDEVVDEAKKKIADLYEEAMKKINGQTGRASGEAGSPVKGDDGGSAKVGLEPIITESLEERPLDKLDKLDESIAEALRDGEIEEKYNTPMAYASKVEIDANKPVEFYIEEMHRVFRDDVNVDNGVVEETLRRRYNEAQEVKLNNSSSGEPLDLNKGAEEFAETPESKLIALEHDAGSAAKNGRSARAFIRSLKIGEHCAGISVYEVMEKVVRPVFFAIEGFDGDGKAKAKYNRLMNKLSARYKKYGFDARGEETAFDGEAQERRGREKIASKIRDFFRRGGRVSEGESSDIDIDEAGANANE